MSIIVNRFIYYLKQLNKEIPMNRRETMKKMILAGGGIVATPAWLQAWHPESLPESVDLFSNEESQMITKIVDAILPASDDGVGGLSVGVDQFLERLFSRCYEKPEQENIRRQLSRLNDLARDQTGMPFLDCDSNQQIRALEQMAVSPEKAESDFFELIKSETIRGFRTSREVMTRYYKYRVAPGKYFGCVQVEIQ
ncbi:MAG: gluconate 2-dehydrogenase subunit 3 family protein [Saprospiraceae bacterium]|nr:gluconate 2-dehydrogenase subunit 3 family protein [Saprospiraceae bacterium]